MRNTLTLRQWNFRGGELNALINLDRVAVDNLAAETERHRNSQRALARSGWTNDGDYAGSAAGNVIAGSAGAGSAGILPAAVRYTLVFHKWFAFAVSFVCVNAHAPENTMR